MSRHRCFVLALFLVLTPSLFSCASTEDRGSDVDPQEDLAFAESLAGEWGFTGLAEEVLDEFDIDKLTPREVERVELLRCKIHAQRAVSEQDQTRQTEFFEQAIAAYEDLLEKNPSSEAAIDAGMGYVNLASAFIRALEISTGGTLGEEAGVMRQRRVEILTAVVARTGRVIAKLRAIDNPTKAQKRGRGNMMLMRGRMLMELGSSQEDGDSSFTQALVILEEVVFDQGEGSPSALRAYDLIGQIYSAQEDWDQASIYFEAVIEQALPEDYEEWGLLVQNNMLDPRSKEVRWHFVEVSTVGLVNSLMAVGDVAYACRYALHLVNTQRRGGFTYSTAHGYPSLLAAARTLFNAGGVVGGRVSLGNAKWYASEEDAAKAGVSEPFRQDSAALALVLAQQVVEENRGTVLQHQAENLIAEVVERSHGVFDPAVLYQAAEGRYNLREDNAALAAFRRVLAALQTHDKATKLEYSPKTYYYMGRSYQRLDRHAEAVMAFKEGCTTWIGDPTYAPYNATGFYKSAQELQRRAPGDPLIESLLKESERIAANLSDKGALGGLGPDRRTNYRGKLQEYQKRLATSPCDETAMVGIGVCKFRLGDLDEALAIFVEYLEEFVTNEENSVGGSGVREAKRESAMATSVFYRALIEYGKKDYQAVVDHTQDYHTKYPEQTRMAPWAMRMVGNSLAKTGRIEDAKAYLRTALEIYPESKHIARFGVEFYRDLNRQHKVTDDPQRQRDLLLDMAQLLEIANKGASPQNFNDLRTESMHWLDLKEWEKALAILETLNQVFGKDGDRRMELETHVLPDLARVYLALQKTPEALEILRHLVISTTTRPSRHTLLDYTRAVVGWVEGDTDDIQEVPGAGISPEEFKDAIQKLDALANGVKEKWACEWYELKFHLAYGYYTWSIAEHGPQDASKMESARKQLTALVQRLGPRFRGNNGVPGVGQSCDNDPERAASLGSGILRRRMVWLWGKVR